MNSKPLFKLVGAVEAWAQGRESSKYIEERDQRDEQLYAAVLELRQADRLLESEAAQRLRALAR